MIIKLPEYPSKTNQNYVKKNLPIIGRLVGAGSLFLDFPNVEYKKRPMKNSATTTEKIIAPASNELSFFFALILIFTCFLNVSNMTETNQPQPIYILIQMRSHAEAF